jgi:CubicO group peptidase (beta-lactamase class C family)
VTLSADGCDRLALVLADPLGSGGPFMFIFILFLLSVADASTESCDQWKTGVLASLSRSVSSNRLSEVWIERGSPASPEVLVKKVGAKGQTQFSLASVSKPLTAIMMARFVDAGALRWDDLISQYLTEDEVPQLKTAAWKQITIRNLAQHTAGIADYLNELPISHLSRAQSFAQMMAQVPSKLNFATGTNLKYSNTGYLMMGRILERVSGVPFTELFERELSSTLSAPALAALPNSASVGGSASVLAGNMLGVGSAIARTEDLISVLRALSSPGALVTEATAREMLSTMPEGCVGERCDRYGFGFSIRRGRFQGQDAVLHQGHLSSTSTAIMMIPSLNVRVTVLTNQGKINLETLITKWLDDGLEANCL